MRINLEAFILNYFTFEIEEMSLVELFIDEGIIN